MTPEFWHQRWRSGRTGWHLPHPNPLLTRHWPALNIPDGSTVFVPLCGKSEDMIWLAEQGYRVLGNELCRQAVEAFFAEQGLTPEITPLDGSLTRWQAEPFTLIEGDFFKLSPELTRETSAVYDRAALVAFPPTMRPDYVRQLRQLAPAGSLYLLISLTGPASPDDGPPFSVPEEEIRTHFADLPHFEQVDWVEVQRKGMVWHETVWSGLF